MVVTVSLCCVTRRLVPVLPESLVSEPFCQENEESSFLLCMHHYGVEKPEKLYENIVEKRHGLSFGVEVRLRSVEYFQWERYKASF